MFATHCATAARAIGVAGLTLAAASAPALSDEEGLRDTVTLLEERVQILEKAAGTGQAAGGPWNVSLTGLVEIEASYTEGGDGNDASDVTAATAELGVDAVAAEWANAHIVLLHEEDETDFEVDEAVLTIANPGVSPLFAAAGRMYVPFGNFETHLVSDPLTLELGETRESVLQLGFETGGAYGSVYTFNGEVEEAASRDHVGHYGANLGYNKESEALGLDLAIGYLSSIADSDGLQDTLGGVELDDRVGGAGAYAVLHAGPFSLIGEYITAAERFAARELNFNGTGARPAAWNLEAAFQFELAGRKAALASAWQGTEEALELGLPENRLLAGVSVRILENTSLSLEWAREEDYGTGTGGTGEKADSFTLQLAAEF